MILKYYVDVLAVVYRLMEYSTYMDTVVYIQID